MSRHIYLTGFMGAGKSRIGRMMAEKFQLPFYDSDYLIEAECGKSVRLIFKEDGEAYFRRLESQVIRNLAQKTEPAVIALGGGALMHHDSLRLVKKSGVLVYLKSSPDHIYERIKHPGERPLLSQSDNSPEAILDKMRVLLEKREPVYTQAHIIIDRDPINLEALPAVIMAEVQNYRKRKHGNSRR